MTTQGIDYASSPETRPRRFRLRVGWVVAGAVGLGLLMLLTSEVRQTQSRIDAVTGTMTWQTTWVFGITSGPVVDVSPLERRLTAMGISWRRDWRFLHNTHRTLLGRPTCFECGSVPPIYEARVVLKEFTAAASDEEIREFVRVMQAGTEAERRAAVDAAAEKGLGAMGGGR